MGDHPHAAAYKEAFRAFADEGSMEAFRSMLADDVVWHTITGETWNGPDAVIASMAEMDVDIQLELHDAIANDKHMIGMVTATITAGDKTITYQSCEVGHVNDEGKVTERWAFTEDNGAIGAWFASLG